MLRWLPFFTSHLQQLQPNQYCPQNKITEIQVRKEGNHIDTDIAAVDWDLHCKTALPAGSGVYQPLPLAQLKDKIDLQIKGLFELLAVFPETTIHIDSLNLHSELLKKKLSFTALIKKTAQHVVLTLSSEPLHLLLKINLLNKQLSIDSSVALEKIEKYIKLPGDLQKYLNNELKISYVSSLRRWEKGVFTLDFKGSCSDLAEQVELTAAGELALLTQQVNLQKMIFNLGKVSHKISPQQEWKTAYIKLNLAEPALINLSSLNLKSLPLQLRVGRSVLVSKIPRGKSRRIRVDKQKLPPLFAAVKARGTVHNMSLDWRLALLNQTLTGKFFYEKNKLKVVTENNQLQAQQLATSLRAYLPALELLEINSGALNLQFSAYYDLAAKAGGLKSTLSGSDIAGKNADVLFDGVSFSGELDYLLAKEQISIKRDKLQLKIANLFIGVPIQAVQLDARVNAGDPVVEHFKARLLGGRMDLDDFRLRAPSQTLINLSGFSLGEVIKYSAYPEIQSKAIIDGELPLSLTEQGPVIKNGMIFARHPGGYIKVPENTVVKAMGRGNPAFTFTMQVLSDLQFDTLQGVLNYAADGESDLKIVIKGVNPALSGTRPVTFNYSHNENILKLLKSLRFNEQLIKQIEERY